MKQHLRRLLQEHFSYSAKERKGMLVLAGILFCLWGVRFSLPYLFPPQPIRIQSEQYETFVANHPETKSPFNQEIDENKSNYFRFDPNTIDSGQILLLGFSPKQTYSWLQYRRAGAIFRKKEDLKKLFIIDDKKYHQLEEWIQIDNRLKYEVKPFDSANLAHDDKMDDQNHRRTKTYRIAINTIDSIGLVAIPGIGPYTAQKVIQYRTWLGGFNDSSQFREIHGLRDQQIERLKEVAEIDNSIIHQLHINTASQETLESHPYIRYKAKIIIAYRKQHGPYKSEDDLLKTGVIDPETIKKLKPYLQF